MLLNLVCHNLQNAKLHLLVVLSSICWKTNKSGKGFVVGGRAFGLYPTQSEELIADERFGPCMFAQIQLAMKKAAFQSWIRD